MSDVKDVRRPDLKYLISPRSVAIVGASDKGDKPGTRLTNMILASAFDGSIYAVNPRKFEAPGLTWVPDIESLPSIPDVACIALPAGDAVMALRQLGERGVRAAIVYSSGFRESGDEGVLLEKELESIANRFGIALCGPNTAGVISIRHGFVGSFTHALIDGAPPAGGAMVLTQSGSIGGVLLSRLRELHLGISHWISIGNGAVLGITEYLEFAVTDPATSIVVLFIEGMQDGRPFLDALRRCHEAGKPVIVVKVGTTTSGIRAAKSHTGNLAGVDKIYDGALAQFGASRVKNLGGVTDLLQFYQWCPPPTGRRVAVMSISGAGCTILADKCDEFGMALAVFSESTRKRLGELLPGYSQHDNPVDLTGTALMDLEILEGVIEAALADDNVDAAVISFSTNCSLDIARAVQRGWKRDKAFAVISPVLGAGPREMCAYLSQQRVPNFTEFEDAIAALSEFSRTSVPMSNDAGSDAHKVVELKEGKATKWLASSAALARLSESGIRIPASLRTDTVAEAMEFVQELDSPVALKIDDEAILHKTEVGGVRLGVVADDVEVGFNNILRNVRNAGFDVSNSRVLVQEMIPRGVEVVVGYTLDEVFGQVLAIGLGGEHVELLDEVAFCVVPASVTEIENTIGLTRLQKFLTVYRGTRRDFESLVAAIVSFQSFCLEDPSVEEAEINPLTVLEFGRGSVAIDARIRLA